MNDPIPDNLVTATMDAVIGNDITAALLPDTINVATPSSLDGAGEITYGSPVEVSAWVDDDSEIVKNSEGQDILTKNKIMTKTAIGTQSRIWLPSLSTSDDTLARTPVQVRKVGTGTNSTLYLVLL